MGRPKGPVPSEVRSAQAADRIYREGVERDLASLPVMLSTKAVAAVLGRSAKSVWEMTRDGRLKASRVSSRGRGQLRIPRSQVVDFLVTHRA